MYCGIRAETVDTESVAGGLDCTSVGTVLAYHAYEVWGLVSNTSEEEEGWGGEG